MTSQERAWAGELGNAYNRRSPGDEQANYQLFRRIFGATAIVPESILELGAGQGANLRALNRIFPKAELSGLEVNQQAAEVLAHTTPCKRVIHASALLWSPDRTWDLILTKGFLIHIPPDMLAMIYATIHRAARRWILLCEYYSPRREMVPYRGQDNLLWKAPHAEEMLQAYGDLRLVDYGFVSELDPYPQDNLNWWLVSK